MLHTFGVQVDINYSNKSQSSETPHVWFPNFRCLFAGVLYCKAVPLFSGSGFQHTPNPKHLNPKPHYQVPFQGYAMVISAELTS